MLHLTRRLLVRALQALALLAWLHFVGVNFLLNSDWLLETLNRRPERLRIGYSHAWCLWPGVVHLRDFELHSQSRRVRWSVRLAEARVHLHLTDLWRREFHALSLAGRGGAVQLERRPDAPPPDADG